MYTWEINRGRRVRIHPKALPFQPDPGPLIITAWPCKGLRQAYVQCRTEKGRNLWFRPEELLPS